MEFWIVVKDVHDFTYVKAFNCLHMARQYVQENCPFGARIERHIMNVGFQEYEHNKGELV